MGDTLRPRSWDEYIGQEPLKQELAVLINAARIDGVALEPVLLIGKPGAGKTALAEIVAHKMGQPLEKLIMPVSFRALATAVRQLSNCVLFLDEIHDLKGRQSELLPLVEFGYLQESSGRRVVADGLSIIGATTEPQDIFKTLRDRMEVPWYDEYTDDEMRRIVLGMADKRGVTIPDDAALLFAQAACGVPRIARKFVLAFDAMEKANGFAPTGEEVMSFRRVAHDGLTMPHLEYLRILDALGGEKGLSRIASLMRLKEREVEELERLLFVKKLIEFGERGRALTRRGTTRVRTILLDAA